MGCFCIDKIFDIYIDQIDNERVVIEDQSVYGGWDNDFDFDNKMLLHVQSLTTGEKREIEIYTNKRNILTSIELNNTSDKRCLKDDIYCFKVNNCGDWFTINRAMLGNAKCKLDYLIFKASKDEIDKKNILTIEMYIDSINILARQGMVEMAKEHYRILEKKLSNVICDCCH